MGKYQACYHGERKNKISVGKHTNHTVYFFGDLIHQSGEKGNAGYWLLHEILNN
jgi:hypothetical protein